MSTLYYSTLSLPYNQKLNFFNMIFFYCIFALVLCYGLFAFFFYRMPFTISWINHFFVKKEKIASGERNRIIFAGGSSTLFGIHASFAEKKFKVPSVNFGIASGLQTDYYFYRLKQIAQEGDLIILPLEYSFYCFDGTVSTIKEQYIRTFDRDYFYKLPPHKLAHFAYNKTPIDLLRSAWDIYRHIRNYRNEMHKKINYNPNMTNANGDQTLNVGNEIFLKKYNNGYYQPVVIPREGSYETAGLALINDFNNWCRENHVKVIFTFASTVYFTDYHTSAYEDYFNFLAEYFKSNNIPYLGSPYDFFYPPESFYDTRYHLNNEAARMNTRQIISKLHQHPVFQDFSSHINHTMN